MTQSHRENAEIIDALLARPQGLTAAEGCDVLPATGMRAMCKRLQHLVAYGKAWNVKTPNCLAHRWFATAAARDAWAAAHPAQPTARSLRGQCPKRQTMAQKLTELIAERGGSGTLPSDLSDLAGKPSGFYGSWISSQEALGTIQSVRYKNTRILTPAGVALKPAALQACQRRVDRTLAARLKRKGKPMPAGRPGVPPGVTIPAKADWRKAPACNEGQVAPTVCPSPKFDHRYQAPPGLQVAGGFAALRPGQYDMPASNSVAQVLAQRRAA